MISPDMSQLTFGISQETSDSNFLLILNFTVALFEKKPLSYMEGTLVIVF